MVETTMEPVLPVSKASNDFVLRQLAANALPQARGACLSNNAPGDVAKPGEVCGLILEKMAEATLSGRQDAGLNPHEPYTFIMMNKGVKGQDPKQLGIIAVDAIVDSSYGNLNKNRTSGTFNATTKDGQTFSFSPTKAANYDAGFVKMLNEYMTTGNLSPMVVLRGVYEPEDYRDLCNSREQPNDAGATQCANAGARHAKKVIEAFNRKNGAGR